MGVSPFLLEVNLISTKMKRAPDQLTTLTLAELHPHPDDPFSVHDDDAMKELTESISSFGVLDPALVRPRKEGGYELLSGKRRKHASELSGKTDMPVIIRDLNDDEAVILLVDANLHRPDIPPSERAKAYKMKLEAIKHQGQRQKSTSTQVVQKLSVDQIAEESGVSRENIRRYIRLTELSPPLQQMVDDKRIAMTPAVELSYLKPREQALLVETIESEQATPSLSQAQRMKKLSQIGQLNEDNMLDIMSEQKKPEREDITLSVDTLRKYFPRSYTPRQMETVILRLLDAWMKKRQHEQSR